MKILHTADLHLGMHPDKGKPWSDERAQALWNAFDRILNAADREKADLLLIAGDLCHSQPRPEDLEKVTERMAALSTAQVVWIAGNHDCINARSHYRDFPWPENVTFLGGSSMGTASFPRLGAQVHGFSYHRAEIREPLYDSLKAPDDGRIHILLGHGGDEKHIPVDQTRLAAAGFHYAAFGHIHKPDLKEELRLAWCGAPEPTDPTDIGPRGYVLADVTRQRTRLRFVPSCTARYIPLRADITPDVTREGLRRSLQRRIEEKGEENIYLVTLRGERDPGTDFSREVPLSGRIVRWDDETRLPLDLPRLRAEHAGDLLGYFLEEMDKLPAGELKDRALSCGVRACLGEKESL